MANPRRNPSAPGLAGLTDADREAWLAGTVTIEELAGRLGISKQAVSTEFRKRGWRKVKAKAAVPSPAPPQAEVSPGSDDLSLPQAIERLYVTTVVGVLDLLCREAKRLQQDKGSIVGPASLKAMAVAVSTLRTELSACGLLDLRQIEPAPTTLIIRTLTLDEEAAIRADAEAAYAAQQAGGAEDDGDKPKADPPAVDIEGALVPATSPLRSGNGPPVRLGWLPGPLPTPERFREWLAFVGQQRGNITLRRILTDLGRERPGLATTRNMLIDQIVEVAKGDPKSLYDMCQDKTDSAG